MDANQLAQRVFELIEEEKELLSDFDVYRFDPNFLSLESSNWGFINRIKERISPEYECEMESKLGNKHLLLFMGKSWKKDPWKKKGPF